MCVCVKVISTSPTQPVTVNVWVCVQYMCFVCISVQISITFLLSMKKLFSEMLKCFNPVKK